MGLHSKTLNIPLFNTMKIVTDKKRIEEIFNRGVVVDVLPSKEEFIKKLQSGEQLKIYIGADATSNSLHLSHAKNYMFLEELRQLGHKVVILFGDFTAQIGDPTGRNAARPQLSAAEIKKNVKNWLLQIKPLMNFGDKINPPQVAYNSKWLAKLTLNDVIKLASNFTVQQMLERDMFEKRVKENKPLFVHEFFYPLMQGYDSVAMDVDGEIGGNDQTFNMLMGRDLIKTLKNKEKFVIATKLLVDSLGKKMGKTDGNAVNMDQSAQDIFGKVMSWSDDMIINAFEVATKVSMDDIRSMKEAMDSGSNPKEFKMRLAKEIISIIHDRESAELAEKAFDSVFKNKEVPENIQEIEIKKDTPIRDKIVESGVVSSNSDWKRLIDSNAITIFPSEEVIKDVYYKANDTVVLRIGKKRFIKIIAE
jgi:tyrosyl-tRNA synthetase